MAFDRQQSTTFGPQKVTRSGNTPYTAATSPRGAVNPATLGNSVSQLGMVMAPLVSLYTQGTIVRPGAMRVSARRVGPCSRYPNGPRGPGRATRLILACS